MSTIVPKGVRHAQPGPFRTCTALVAALSFLARNVWYARRLAAFRTCQQGGIVLQGLSPSQFSGMSTLYSRLHNGTGLQAVHRLLLWLLASRFCLVATDEHTGQVVGMALYYLNARDRRENTVHQAFTGVLPERQRNGIGSALRSHAQAHFAACGLGGVSSRVSLSNETSLRINLRLGFRPVEQYFDPAMGEERYYLVRRFQPTGDAGVQAGTTGKEHSVDGVL